MPDLSEVGPHEHLFNILKAVAGLQLPVAGALASLLGDYIPKRREENIKEFLHVLAIEVDRLTETQQAEMATDEFARLLTLTLQGVASEHREEKVRAYRNALVHSLVDEVEFDVKELHVMRLDRISALQLRVFGLYAGSSQAPGAGGQDPLLSRTGPWINRHKKRLAVASLLEYFPGLGKDALHVALDDLMGLGLIEDEPENFIDTPSTRPRGDQSIRLSGYGYAFYRFIEDYQGESDPKSV